MSSRDKFSGILNTNESNQLFCFSHQVQIQKIWGWLHRSRTPVGLSLHVPFCFTNLIAVLFLIACGFKMASLSPTLCLYLKKGKGEEQNIKIISTLHLPLSKISHKLCPAISAYNSTKTVSCGHSSSLQGRLENEVVLYLFICQIFS